MKLIGQMRLKVGCIIAATLLTLPGSIAAQETVRIRVNAAVTEGAIKPAWAFFGYDEPNYTYAKNGKRLLRELAALSPVPIYVRTHNLLTSGDGTPALKWGSTNVYTEDSEGQPVYDWKIVDRIFDAYRDAGVRPFVEIGFMPSALSVHPEPYEHDWPKGPLWTGWAYPPKDYFKWAGLIREWALHSIQRYGRREVASWYWEVWNEPDIGYWQGTPDEYFKLYDYTVDALKRALPEAQVGGPATTGPASAKTAAFLSDFLNHCESGKNYATGATGAPLDFISFHAKGITRMADGHVEMKVGKNLADISKGLEIVTGHPKSKDLPVFITESDPEGCAACAASSHPQNGYRNTAQYASYEAEMQINALRLAARYGVNLSGVLTWAFEYDDQPCFAGFRTLATCGIDKPVLNAFRMLGLMRGEQIRAGSDGALPLDSILTSSVREAPDIDALASRDGQTLSILVWNYHDDDVPAPSVSVELTAQGIPTTVRQVLVEHFRIDGRLSNSFSLWRQMESPQQFSPDQAALLQAAGQLQTLGSPQWTDVAEGKVALRFELPRQAVSLIRLTW